MRCNKNKHFTKDTLSLEKITIKTNLLETREKNRKEICWNMFLRL